MKTVFIFKVVSHQYVSGKAQANDEFRKGDENEKLVSTEAANNKENTTLEIKLGSAATTSNNREAEIKALNITCFLY